MAYLLHVFLPIHVVSWHHMTFTRTHQGPTLPLYPTFTILQLYLWLVCSLKLLIILSNYSSCRILLMREALILLNRLASNPMYSAAVLGMLTHSRATASLTVDVAERISNRSRACQSSDGMKRVHSKEAEIADLSRVFRTRVFAFLDNNTP